MEGKTGLAAVLENLDDRIRTIEKCGCAEGNVRRERLTNVMNLVDKHQTTIDKIFEKIDAINNKFITGLIILTIMGLLAGVNVASILHLIPK